MLHYALIELQISKQSNKAHARFLKALQKGEENIKKIRQPWDY